MCGMAAHGGGSTSCGDRHELGGFFPAHTVLVVVGQHDDVAPVGPHLVRAGLDPAAAGDHDVEEHDAYRFGSQYGGGVL